MARKSLVTHIAESDIKLLRVFKAVVDSGGLSAAETDLNIGRSTISKYLADLEIRLDLKLCHRGPGGFALTEDGRKVLFLASNLLASVSEFQSEVNQLKQHMVGSLHVALFDQCASNPECRLARSINTFNRLAPEVQIELSLEPPNVIETMVNSGQVDIGIIAEHRTSNSLNYAPLYGENMYLYCGNEHPLFERDQSDLDIDEIRKASYAGISVNSPNLHIGQTLKLRRSAQVQSEQALSILILSGRFVGFLPDHLTTDFVRRGQMKPLLPEEVNYRVGFSAVTRRSPGPNRITNLFLQTLLDKHSS